MIEITVAAIASPGSSALKPSAMHSASSTTPLTISAVRISNAIAATITT